MDNFTIEYGETVIDPQKLSDKLLNSGYARVEMVEAAGQFAVRGGILDVYPSSAKYTDIDGKETFGSFPFRIELFGDEIDRMEIFDVETQRMTVTLDKIDFAPSREILLSPDAKKKMIEAIRSHFSKSRDERAMNEMTLEITALESGADANFADKYG